MYVSIGQAASMLGISISSLRRWERENKFHPAFRTTGKHRRYKLADLREKIGALTESTGRKVICYARVSSHDQKADLNRQVERLNRHCQSDPHIES